MTASSLTATPQTAPQIDLAALKTRQQAMWGSGDYAAVAATINLVSENLCEAADISGGERVLDVACGSGNAAIAAARRFADVTGLDYVPQLVDQARTIARALRLPVAFIDGDAEALPFATAEFDAVLSVFGVMFAPDEAKSAAELRRVCRPGGRIALASWTPEGFIGEMFKIVGSHVRPAPGAPSPLRWGAVAGLAELFPGARIQSRACVHVFRYRSAAHWFELFRTCYGPTLKAFESLDTGARQALEADLMRAFHRASTPGRDGKGVAVEAEYLQTIITP